MQPATVMARSCSISPDMMLPEPISSTMMNNIGSGRINDAIVATSPAMPITTHICERIRSMGVRTYPLLASFLPIDSIAAQPKRGMANHNQKAILLCVIV